MGCKLSKKKWASQVNEKHIVYKGEEMPEVKVRHPKKTG
jgi:hypothetical protein